MNEHCAREVTLLEAFETAEPPSPHWSDADRAWADRVAREAVGPEASGEDFIEQRARHALQRLAPREPLALRVIGRSLQAGRWVLVLGLIAFGVGLVADSVGGSRRINLLAPPLWGVIAWNVLVYLVVAGAALARLARRRPTSPGPLVRGLRRFSGMRERLPRAAQAGSAGALQHFAALWSERSRPLAVLRTEGVLHAAAAALGLGLIAGLYARGLVFDYRAAWESTFLSAATAHGLVTTLLAPASALSGIALPDVAGFAGLRAVPGDPSAGAPAAAWIHLLGLTLALVVVVPRLLLAGWGAARIAMGSRRFALPLKAPYYQRLARLQRGAAARVGVWPYGLTPSPGATLGLQALLGESFGPRVAVQVAPTVAYGAEDEARIESEAGLTHVVALFDMNATPESENQGLFYTRVAAAAPAGARVIALVDEAAFLARFSTLADRVEQRRQAWRDWGRALGMTPVFVDLSAPASAQRAAALDAGAAASPGLRP